MYFLFANAGITKYSFDMHFCTRRFLYVHTYYYARAHIKSKAYKYRIHFAMFSVYIQHLIQQET